MARKLVIASNNKGKIAELTDLLAPLGLQPVAQGELGVSEAEEPAVTFVENAIIKARHAARVTGLPALADDSGLTVDALDGRPGVRSARFAGEEATDNDNGIYHMRLGNKCGILKNAAFKKFNPIFKKTHTFTPQAYSSCKV